MAERDHLAAVLAVTSVHHPMFCDCDGDVRCEGLMEQADAVLAAGYIPGHLDPDALHLADMAYMDTPGAPADKVKAAVRGYLFAMRGRKAFDTGSVIAYPSLNELRAELADQEDR